MNSKQNSKRSIFSIILSVVMLVSVFSTFSMAE